MPLAIELTGDWVLSILALVLAIVGTPVIILKMRGGFDDRADEDAARDFFDRHGRWPDQTEEEAAAERARLAAAVPPPLAAPDEHGRV